LPRGRIIGALRPFCLNPPPISHATCWRLCSDIDPSLIQNVSHCSSTVQQDPPLQKHGYAPVPLSRFINDRPHLRAWAVENLSDWDAPPSGPLPPVAQPRSHPNSPHIMARVYADVNANMPRSYWDYDSVNISWGALENYEVVRKIGMTRPLSWTKTPNVTVRTREIQ
jgi:hypothetical protein